MNAKFFTEVNTNIFEAQIEIKRELRAVFKPCGNL